MLMKKIVTIEEFMNSSLPNWWCREGDFSIYLVKSINGKELITTNFKNKNRETNLSKKIKYRKTGKFAPFMDALEATARLHGFKYLRVSCVVNEFLPEVLARRGYDTIYIGHEHGQLDMRITL